MRYVNFIDDLSRDLRYAVRVLRRSAGFAALAVLIMTLGIGANATMFGVIRAVFLRPLPFPEPDRLVTIWESDPERGAISSRISSRMCRRIIARTLTATTGPSRGYRWVVDRR